MNGMRLPYLSEILERRELGVDLKAIVPMFNDTGVTDLDAWSAVSNIVNGNILEHYVSYQYGGEGDVTEILVHIVHGYDDLR